MSDHSSANSEATLVLNRLLQKLRSRETGLPQSEHRVVRRPAPVDPRARSIVEVTEELLRQLGRK